MSSLSMNILDVTDRKEKGLELHKVIVREVKAAVNSNLFLPIPNLLKVTQEQYDDLDMLSAGVVKSLYYSDDRLYTTPYNVMEVRVDKPKLTFREAHQLDDKTFDEWEKANDA